MKRIACIILVIWIVQVSFAQKEETKIGSYERSPTNISNIANINPLSPGAVGFDDRYEGVKGTPLRYDDWVEGNLFLKDNAWVRNLKMNLDIHDNFLYILSPENGQIFTLSNEEISEIHLFSEGETILFRKFLPEQFDSRIDPDLLFEVLAQGEYTFLKLSKKLFKEADYQGAYSADRRYDEFVPSTSYYLTNSEGLFEKIKLTEKALCKLLPDQKSRIREIVKNTGISEGEEMVMAVLKGLSF